MMAEDERLLHHSAGHHNKIGVEGVEWRGPRTLRLRKSENDSDFGFTLRHFIVYPPESYTVKRTAMFMGEHCSLDEDPVETIFVRSVSRNSPACSAGLQVGDRLLAVNGEPTAGRPYSHVVQLVQRTDSCLDLVVVPRHQDPVQLHFGETAHNPETNQRPGCLRSPEMHRQSPNRHPAFSSPRRSVDSNTCQRVPTGVSMLSMDNSLDYGEASCYSLPLNSSCVGSPSCRVSLDGVGSQPRDSRESSINSIHSSDDSIIMSRIKKSFEQKEEFLRRPVAWPGEVVQREFYGRPGRLQGPVWPPAIPASAVPPAAPPSPPLHDNRGFVCGGAVTNPPAGRCLTRMSRVQEPCRVNSPPTPSLRLVSERARQFETGLCQADRTLLYRSELARLGSKNSVPNVAVRRREFENRASDWKAHGESRSLDSATTSNSSLVGSSGTPCVPSGNRTIPVGGTKLHCEPPKDYRQASPERDNLLRPRSNSLETEHPEDSRRHRAVRQASYLAAVNKFFDKRARRRSGAGEDKKRSGIYETVPQIWVEDGEKKPVRPTRLDLARTFSPAESRRVGDSDGSLTPQSWPGLEPVVRRSRTAQDSQDDERATRRVSYLKATWGDRIHMDTDLDLSDSEPAYRSIVAIPPSDKELILEGCLTCKVTQVDGKKCHDRSWRSVWAVLRADILYLFKDKKDSTCQTPVDHDRVDISSMSVSVAEDYNKRRHVLKLSSTASSELLLQADSREDMARWLHALHHDNNNTQSTSSLPSNSATKGGIIKLTSLRNRSPTGQSPTIKARKPSQSDTGVERNKTKTWKGRMAKQLRKMGGSSPVSPTPYPEGATIGIPLDLCPQSAANEFVPLLVELCTGIVEEKGLDIIGIYRVPGNTAAISSLTEAVNRGLDSALLDQDQRWSDVNVISSLLKSFFRKLPDCLLTSELYPLFIEADKIEDQTKRVATLRKLVHELPDHNFHTLRHLMFHLKTVVDHSGINKMEARNLAIVFGPTLIKASDDNMTTLVTDMSHQCRIVETLILYVDWCFSEDSVDALVLKEDQSSCELPDAESSSQTLLLDNIHKVEGLKESPTRDVSAKDIVTSIISAANRKMQKARTRKTILSITEETLPENETKNKGDLKGWRGQRKERSGSAEETTLGKGSVASRVSESVFFSGSVASKILSSNDSTSDKESETRSESAATANSSVEGGTIRSYTGLHQVTQERVRRFEMETKAMLQRAKKENTNTSLTAIGQPKATSKEAVDNIGKRLKTCKEVSAVAASLIRKGSLDSLNAAWGDWPSNNSSDECGDLLISLTSTFDAKMKNLRPGSGGSPDEGERQDQPTTQTTLPTPLDQPLCKSNEGKSKEGEENEKEVITEKEEEEEEKENCNSKLRRSESLNKRDEKRDLTKLRRTESLNKKEGKVCSDKLKRSDSLTKTEKTESNLNKRRQLEAGKLYKMKRKTGGSSERSIKRRHTVGGTKDLDKVTWLDNRQTEEEEKGRRTSSPDLSRHVLMEVRPWSLVKPTSNTINLPLESHM